MAKKKSTEAIKDEIAAEFGIVRPKTEAEFRARAGAPVLDVEDKETDPDEALITTTGAAIRGFMGGVLAFLTTAREIERAALATLSRAKALQRPETGDQDLSLQAFIRQTTAEKKAAEEHWSITATVSRFHRTLTARRGKATDALDQANSIGNTLHNQYVELARRRAAEEQERVRREVEDQARKDRDAELARMEAEAVASEEASPKVSEREQLFCDLVVATGNGQSSASRAGFKNPLQASARLLSMPKIQAVIKSLKAAQAIRQQATARAAEPVDVDVPTIAPDVVEDGSRTTWTAEILDPQAFVRAVVEGRSGIPLDALMPNQVALNEYARSLHERLDRWPGLHAKKSTKVVR